MRYPPLMTEPKQKLTPAEPDDLANSLSFALRFEGRKSKHDSGRLNADIVAKRLVRYEGKPRAQAPTNGVGNRSADFG